ncbi:MAG: hypothetical protein ABR963_03800 [Acidimicrobiales bacterium]
MKSPSRTGWFLITLVFVVAVGSVVVALSRGTTPTPWRWRAEGVLELHPKCSTLGRAEVPSTCQFQVANPPVLSKRVKLDVRVHNTGTVPLCYGLSISTSYLAGLQSFCAEPGTYGSYVTTSRGKYYVDFELDLFVSDDSKSEPLSPIPSSSRSPFTITFGEVPAAS